MAYIGKFFPQAEATLTYAGLGQSLLVEQDNPRKVTAGGTISGGL